MRGSIGLGIGFGIVSLLARWATGNSFLFSPEVLVKYGILGGIGYSIVGALVFITLGFFAKIIRERFPSGETIGDALKQKLHPAGYWFMVILLILLGTASLLFQALGAGILTHTFLHVHVLVGTSVFLVACLLLGGIGGMYRIHQFSILTIIIIFSAIIIIPVYSYIQEGVHPVYKGIRLYHPYILFFKNTDTILYICTLILVALGLTLTDRPTWQHIFNLKKEKIKITFTMLGLIWATIPLALTSLIMVAISGRGFDQILSLVFDLQTTILLILFALFCIFAILTAMSNELNALTTLLVKNVIETFSPLTDQERWRYSSISAIFICILLLIVIAILPHSIALFYLFGNMYAALLLPMLYIILSKRSVPTIIPFSSIISAFAGYITSSFVGTLQSIWVSFFVSAFICLTVLLVRKIKQYSFKESWRRD